jgi:FAD/FMN-containing dehydrogenase
MRHILDPNTHDAFNLLNPEDTVSSAAVYPGSVEEVQAVVRWANKFRIPIFPISIGRNREKYLPTHHTLSIER